MKIEHLEDGQQGGSEIGRLPAQAWLQMDDASLQHYDDGERTLFAFLQLISNYCVWTISESTTVLAFATDK